MSESKREELELSLEKAAGVITDILGEMLVLEGFDPPPWDMYHEHPEKTEGWLERQRWEKENRK